MLVLEARPIRNAIPCTGLVSRTYPWGPHQVFLHHAILTLTLMTPEPMTHGLDRLGLFSQKRLRSARHSLRHATTTPSARAKRGLTSEG